MPYMSQTGYIGIAKQTASGTYVTPAKYLYTTAADIAPDTDLLIPDPEIGSGRAIADDVYVGPIKWTGSIEFNLRNDAACLLFYGACGAVTSSGESGQSGAYGHKFTLQNQLIPLSIEKRVSDGLENFGYTDCKVNTLRFEAAAGEVVSCSADIIAKTETSGKTVQTETYETGPILTYAGGSVTLDGTVMSVKNATFELNNNLVDDDFRLGDRKLGSMVEKRRELSASLDIVPSDSNQYKKAVYGATGATTTSGGQTTAYGSLRLNFKSADGVYISTTTCPYTVDIYIEKAIFRSAPLPVSGDDMIIQTIELLPVEGTVEKEAVINVRNSVSSY